MLYSKLETKNGIFADLSFNYIILLSAAKLFLEQFPSLHMYIVCIHYIFKFFLLNPTIDSNVEPEVLHVVPNISHYTLERET